MRAMILSAGFGTRLWPLTEDRTKPAIPILGKPLVGYVAEYLASHGCREIVVNLHHRPESVRASLGDGSAFGVKLFYIEESEILGTSGALDNARALLDTDTFVVINGKIITDIDLTAALETHKQHHALATLVLMRNTRRERFSVVETRDGLITHFGGMPEQSDVTSSPLMFTGIQILDRRIFDYIPHGVFSHSTTDVYPKAVAKGERVVAHVAAGRWRELSTLQRYLDISIEILHEKGLSFTAGDHTFIAASAAVQDAVLWDNVAIAANATVRNAVLGDNVQIREGEVVENAVVVPIESIKRRTAPEKSLRGHVEGDNFVVPLAG
ncbi:MAG: sugar phosphate nucleotidyltransferase [Pyrinomonadaceae bacterium]